MEAKKIIKYLLIAIAITFLANTCGKSYAKFVITRQFKATFSSYPFYFEAAATKNSFDYNASGITIPINIANYIDNSYNEFNTEYEITLADNTKFQLSNAVNGTIEGNTKKTNEESIKINSVEGADIGSSEVINIVIKSTEPYYKEITIPVTIKKSGELYAFMRDQAKGQTDQNFDFHNPNFVQNGVFMNYESINKAYPVYYYRGAVNNSIIYANHCWQIVRTTETGGLKIIYDGEVKNGQCTDDRDRLGTEYYNEKPNGLASPSQVGYMYGEIENILTVSTSRVNDMRGKPGAIQDVTDLIKNELATDEKIIAGANINWNGNSYQIENSKEYTVAEGVNTARLLFKKAIEDEGDNNRYTCISSSNTCDTVYYLYKRDSEDVQAVILEGGETDYKAAITLVKNVSDLIKNELATDEKIIAGANINWNGNSYQIENSKEYTVAEGVNTARLLFKKAIEDEGDNNRYTCISSSNTCDTVYYLYKRNSETVYAIILKNGETSYESIIEGKTIKIGTVFGNDVTYDETTKQYTLKDTIEVSDLDELEDDIRGGTSSTYYGKKTPDAFHYTCLTDSATCENVYYIYYNNYGDITDDPASDSGGLFGIKMEDGKNVTETLDALLYGSTNINNSHAKAYIDEWFQGLGSDFKKGGDPLIDHLEELEDAVFCNDRTIAGYHGWDKDADNHDSHNKYLHFDAFKRVVGEGTILPSRPRLSCDIKNDAFTVANSAGNQKLTYPIALLDADEAVLAGAIFGKPTNTYLTAATETFLMSAYYISDDHVRMFAIDVDGSLDDVYSASSYGIRPAIVLKDIFTISGGDGSKENPYTLEKS